MRIHRSAKASDRGLCGGDYLSATNNGNPVIVDDCGVSETNQANQIWVLPV